MLTTEQRSAFASIRTVWPHERIVLIGAGALRLQKRLSRFTADLDVAVAVELPEYADTLLRSAGFRGEPNQPQRWTHENGVQIDILPAGQALRARGYVEWPNAHRMSLEGFDALFSNTLPFVAADLGIEMATVPLIVLLKMVAWLDRPADRSRDLQDLAFLLADYLDEGNDADFERILDAIQQGHVEHQTAQAFLLGQDVARCQGAADIARRFVHSLSTSYRWMLGAMQRTAPAALSRDEAFDAAWKSFVEGLGLHPLEP
jgi:predicted nucleotidyltransferase